MDADVRNMVVGGSGMQTSEDMGGVLLGASMH